MGREGEERGGEGVSGILSSTTRQPYIWINEIQLRLLSWRHWWLLNVTFYNADIVTENPVRFVVGRHICVNFTGFRVHVYKITRKAHPCCQFVLLPAVPQSALPSWLCTLRVRRVLNAHLVIYMVYVSELSGRLIINRPALLRSLGSLYLCFTTADLKTSPLRLRQNGLVSTAIGFEWVRCRYSRQPWRHSVDCRRALVRGRCAVQQRRHVGTVLFVVGRCMSQSRTTTVARRCQLMDDWRTLAYNQNIRTPYIARISFIFSDESVLSPYDALICDVELYADTFLNVASSSSIFCVRALIFTTFSDWTQRQLIHIIDVPRISSPVQQRRNLSTSHWNRQVVSR